MADKVGVGIAKEKKNQKRGLITKTWERCKSISRGGNVVPSSAEARRRLTKKSKSSHSPSRTTSSVPSQPSEVYSSRQPGAGDDKIHKNKHKKHRIAPEGCFSVYVGPEKQRFVIRTECANHPLFRLLLEEAEAEYGYCSSGPLELPCRADMFRRVLEEMDSDDSVGGPPRGRGFTHGGVGGHRAYRLLSPSRMMAINQF